MGACDVVLRRLDVLVPLLTGTNVRLADLPALVGISKPLLEPAKLFVLGDSEENLHQLDPVVDEHCFELIDFVVGALPRRFGSELVDSLHQHPPVPGAVKDRNASRQGKASPKTIEPMPPLLLR